MLILEQDICNINLEDNETIMIFQNRTTKKL